MSAAKHYLKPGATDVWLTPPEIVNSLGPFDLDPCANKAQPFAHAPTQFTEAENGLAQKWHGRVWMNPPYSTAKITLFVERFIEHGNGIALVFPRVDTRWFQRLAVASDALFLLKGRIKFVRPDGSRPSAGALGSVFAAIGKHNVAALQNSGFEGVLLRK